MEGAWRKVRQALGLRLCVHAPAAGGGNVQPAQSGAGGCRRDAAVAVAAPGESGPNTPAGAIRRSKSGGKSSSLHSSKQEKCAICFASMRSGHGQALFTAECSHMFHFQCISSNVKHGNYVCPVCRAKWKEIPYRSLSSTSPHGRIGGDHTRSPQQDPHLALHQQVSNRRREVRRLRTSEPADYNDDEPLQRMEAFDDLNFGSSKTAEISSYPEFQAVPQSTCLDGFDILIHVKAPTSSSDDATGSLVNGSSLRLSRRVPIDIVTVLDVSGSMAGTKMALLKQAMGFVIQHLRPSDRLSVIAFSSTARRLFPLQRMSHHGRQQALQAINSLGAGGGTNIADALKKAVKVIADRSYKNSVCSIILLSDGQDTYNISSNFQGTSAGRRSLVPSANPNELHMVPLHTFGFGADHDSDTLHSISEASGGTFSFIEDEGVMQDAFAQCIGGLLSVAVREMRLSMECVDPGVLLCSIKSGSYPSKVARDGRNGFVDIAHLYADEEKDILLSVTIPKSCEQTSLLRVACAYKDPVSNETIKIQGDEVKIKRPASTVSVPVSIEVDRERNRIRATNSMESAWAAAERGALSEAVTILEDCRRALSQCVASQNGDRLCMALVAELREMQERMANRQLYEASGRAYMLSGLSSHSWQRATARGDSTDSTTLVHSYQTPSMVQMLEHSQNFGSLPQGRRPQVQGAGSVLEKPSKGR
ncbi:Putative RING zinc finger and VWF domain family protein [Zea mays]|uniref:Putative RING zinc finger and VWF domain family protein n=1 Tax=Zea mays TaxID=4577 RepID=K7TUS1_MAIZE|nr:Putative RING zinc finger and VWF domain family protein [Zea mays]